jgi:hypothetical protein
MPNFDPLGLLIAAGRSHSWDSDIKFGMNDAVGQAWECIWAQGGSPLINSTPTVIEFTSSDGEDHSASSGARTIEFSGVDSDYVQQTETITMTGTSAASSVGSFLYLYRMKVLTSGSSKGNVGVISAAVGGSTMGTIPAGSGQSEMLYRPVPASSVLYMSGLGVAVDKGADVELRIREFDQDGNTWRVKLVTHSYQNTNPIRLIPPYTFPEKHLVTVEAKTSNAAGFEVSGWFDYVISQGDT